MNNSSKTMGVAAMLALAFVAGRLSLLAGGGSVASAQPGQDPPPANEMPPEMQAMLEVGTPGDHHRHLDQFIGEWTGEFTLRTAPDAAPMVSQATIVREWVMGGRFVKEVVEARSDMGTFHGLGFMGYNNFDGRYEMVWMDDMSTAIYTEKGTYHSDEKVMHTRGEHRDPVTGRVVNAWSKLDFNDPDRHLMTGYATDLDGRTFKAIEAVLVRVR